MRKSIFIPLDSIKKSFHESIFVPLNLVKESFYEIDSRTRIKIYIYLWYTSYITFAIYLLREFFIFNPPNKIVLHMGNLKCILSSILDIIGITYLSLRRMPKNTFFKVYIEIFITLRLLFTPLI